MGKEIERKFLVRGTKWKSGARRAVYRQGYLSTDPARTVRVRIAGGEAFVTIKGRRSGAARPEFEYPIPVDEAEELLETLCRRPLIEKTRHEIPVAGHVWVIDEFTGENRGLVLAEVELRDETEDLKLPEWAGEEVTHDSRYENSSLVDHPFSRWRS